MHSLSFGSKEFAIYLDSLSQEGLEHLLDVAISLVEKNFIDDSRAMEAIAKWRNQHFPVDEEYASLLSAIATKEDNEYLRLEDAGANHEEYNRHYCLMWLFTGLSQLYRINNAAHSPVYEILDAFRASTNDPEKFIQELFVALQ